MGSRQVSHSQWCRCLVCLNQTCVAYSFLWSFFFFFFFTVTIANTFEKGEYCIRNHKHHNVMYWSLQKLSTVQLLLLLLCCAACCCSGLPPGLPCVFRDVLLDLLEVHLHSAGITVQKGSSDLSSKSVDCRTDSRAILYNVHFLVAPPSSSCLTRTKKDMKWRRGRTLRSKYWSRLRRNYPFSAGHNLEVN